VSLSHDPGGDSSESPVAPTNKRLHIYFHHGGIFVYSSPALKKDIEAFLKAVWSQFWYRYGHVLPQGVFLWLCLVCDSRTSRLCFGCSQRSSSRQQYKPQLQDASKLKQELSKRPFVMVVAGDALPSWASPHGNHF